MVMQPAQVPAGAVAPVDLTNPGWANMQTSFAKSPLKEFSGTLVGFRQEMSTGNNPRPNIVLQFNNVQVNLADVFVTETTAEIAVPHSEYMNSGWGALGKSAAEVTNQAMADLKLVALQGQRLHMYRNDYHLFFVDNKTGTENRGTCWTIKKLLGVGENLVPFVNADEQLPVYLAKVQAGSALPATAPPPPAPTAIPAPMPVQAAPPPPPAAPPVPVAPAPEAAAPVAVAEAPVEAAPVAAAPVVDASTVELNAAEKLALQAMHQQTKPNWWNAVIADTSLRAMEGGAELMPTIIDGTFVTRMQGLGMISVAGEGDASTFTVVGM